MQLAVSVSVAATLPRFGMTGEYVRPAMNFSALPAAVPVVVGAAEAAEGGRRVTVAVERVAVRGEAVAVATEALAGAAAAAGASSWDGTESAGPAGPAVPGRSVGSRGSAAGGLFALATRLARGAVDLTARVMVTVAAQAARVRGQAASATAPPQSLVTYTISVVAEEVGGYRNASKGIDNVLRALQKSTLSVNGELAPFVINLRKAASTVKTYGLSQVTATSVRVVRVGAPVVVRSVSPTVAPTGVPTTATVVAKQVQFLWTLPQMGYVWFPIAIFFGGLCVMLPCCYCCGGTAVLRKAKKACVCAKGSPALDEEEFGTKYRASRSSAGAGAGAGAGGGFRPTDPNDLERSISISGLQEQAAKKSLFLLKGAGSPNRGKYSLVGQRERKEGNDEEEKL